jgi:Holliday junction resolvase RusA-like endonuclease
MGYDTGEEIMKLTIHGNPIPKKRPRFARMGKFVKTYNPQKKEVDAVRLAMKAQWKGKPLTEAVSVRLVFIMPIPKSTTKKKLREILAGEVTHIKKPDLDNLVKFYFDCLNKIVWVDDSQVTEIQACKFYGETPLTMISVIFKEQSDQ